MPETTIEPFYDELFAVMDDPTYPRSFIPIPPLSLPTGDQNSADWLSYTMTRVAVQALSSNARPNWRSAAFLSFVVDISGLVVKTEPVMIPLNRAPLLLTPPDYALNGWGLYFEFPWWIEQLQLRLFNP